jgi:hypothetical protein
MKAITDDLACWSVFHEIRQLDFNGHLWRRDGGNVLIDRGGDRRDQPGP